MRFFEHYYVSDPMMELMEADARSRSYCVERLDAPLLHYRSILEGQLERVIYPDLAPDQTVVKFHAERYKDAPFWIVSPVERDDAGVHYDIWYLESASTRPTRVHYDNSDTRCMETFFDEDDRLVGTTERRFHEWGEHIETITRDETGRIVSIDD